MIEQARAADRRRLGDSHASTLISMAQLASLFQESGELAEAEALWRECLQGRVATLGAESAATLRTRASLAYVLHLRGSSGEAGRLLTEALEAQERLLGSDHPDTTDSRKRPGEISNPRGKWHAPPP